MQVLKTISKAFLRDSCRELFMKVGLIALFCLYIFTGGDFILPEKNTI